MQKAIFSKRQDKQSESIPGGLLRSQEHSSHCSIHLRWYQDPTCRWNLNRTHIHIYGYPHSPASMKANGWPKGSFSKFDLVTLLGSCLDPLLVDQQFSNMTQTFETSPIMAPYSGGWDTIRETGAETRDRRSLSLFHGQTALFWDLYCTFVANEHEPRQRCEDTALRKWIGVSKAIYPWLQAGSRAYNQHLQHLAIDWDILLISNIILDTNTQILIWVNNPILLSLNRNGFSNAFDE